VIDLDAMADAEVAKLKRPCWICSIPEREWVDKAIKDGRSAPVIAAVLIKQGHADATVHRVKGHRARHGL
jgi:hypothetical protein